MKINPIVCQTTLSAYRAQRALEKAGDSPQTADKVSLSEEVVSFSSTFSKLKETMDLRNAEEQAYIESISARVNQGTYYVPGNIVAAKIIEDYLLLN